MKCYKVAQVGAGRRGLVHIEGFMANPGRFEVAAICDLDKERLAKCKDLYDVNNLYTDAESMMREIRPDVLSFTTQPGIRLPMVELAANYGAKAVVMEKPMAVTLKEAREILELCRQNAMKAIVCHQHKYMSSMQELKRIVDEGQIGEITSIHATTKAWLSQLGTHYTDYILWINGGIGAEWVVGHIHGRGKLDDSHPSPDYMLGEACMKNSVRALISCGYLSPAHLDYTQQQNSGYYPYEFWVDNRLTVFGTHGYVWADPDGRWEAFTRSSGGNVINGRFDSWIVQEKDIQAAYLKDLADWLDDDAKVHPCNIEISYHGHEILEGMCLSAMKHTRIDLPLQDNESGDLIAKMKAVLPHINSGIYGR